MTLPESVSAVLVPVDGSHFSMRAIPIASCLAQRLHADLHLLRAVRTVDEVARRDAELAAIRVEVDGRPPGRLVVVDLDVAGAIHEALRRLAPAVACMATHGRGRSAAILGSVAMETLARGHDPLILVGPFVGDGPKPEHEPRGVLVCVDQSPASKDLVADGLAWAGRVGEPLLIATVAEPVPEPVRPHPGHRRFGPDGDVDVYLADLAAPVLGRGVDVTTHAIWDPISPADGVRHYLRECPAFLTLAGSHARTGLARLALGSVAAAMVLHSRSPVVVTPIGGAE